MDARLMASVAAVALLLVPATAQETDSVGTDSVVADEVRCLDARGPPCGYILPTIDIVVEDKQACGGGRLIYAEGPPEDCEPLMADGESRTFDALFRWYWELSEDGTYPKEVGQDIEVSFSGTATNPDWLKVKVEGTNMVDGKFIIDDVTLLHPDHLRTDDSTGSMKVWYEYEEPITITFTRDGSPKGEDLERIDSRHGVPAFFLKSKSSASEPRFKEAFGVEEFRFNTCVDETVAPQIESCGVAPASGDAGIPGPSAVLLLGALAGLALRRRA